MSDLEWVSRKKARRGQPLVRHAVASKDRYTVSFVCGADAYAEEVVECSQSDESLYECSNCRKGLDVRERLTAYPSIQASTAPG